MSTATQAIDSRQSATAQRRQVSPAWSITFDVLYLARDLYDVIEASTLSEEQRMAALNTVALGAKPGPKGLDLVCPEYPVAREWIQLRERSLIPDLLPLDQPEPLQRRSHRASDSNSP